MINTTYLLSPEAGEQMIKKELQTAALFEKTIFELFMYMDVSVLFVCLIFALIYNIISAIKQMVNNA